MDLLAAKPKSPLFLGAWGLVTNEWCMLVNSHSQVSATEPKSTFLIYKLLINLYDIFYRKSSPIEILSKTERVAAVK